jgi:phosphopantothenoylcysteine decarboxylase/phosphopantothenate--cysteine ligase
MEHHPFQNKRILLGVTGSIACYKSAELASKLAQAGAQVDVILTQAAQQFVTPLTFQSVTGRRAYTEADLWGSEGHVQHIGLARQADLLIIAPASANTLAKLAHGIADNLLTITALAATCPLILAPAMDGNMYAHSATQANLEIMQQRGALLIGPASGHLASGMVGVGRMVEPPEILARLRKFLARSGPLNGYRLVITAGGSQEPIDPVRVIANRSSGKQGFALAQAAIDRGAEVTLITGSTSLEEPFGAERINIFTAQEMQQAVLQSLPAAKALIMAAAVADFRPSAPADYKLKKNLGIPEIKLERTPDILQAVLQYRLDSGWTGICVGFAAESDDLLENARAKLAAKKLDMIVANDISASDAGFAVDNNRVSLLFPDGRVESLPLMSKYEVAQTVMEHVVKLLGED